VLNRDAPRTTAHSTARRLRHVTVLDPIRGAAALAVCLFHFTNGNESLLATNDPVRQFAYFGHYGVEAFFVVSGFVIPYSQFARNHQWGNIGSFMLRRLKRLEPPYLACIALVLILNIVSSMAPGYRGAAVPHAWPQLAAHFAYANAFLGYKWLNPVFWTLAIEFQFYLLMACVFPFVAHRLWPVRLATSGCLAAAAWLCNGASSCIPH
jgi:peptidoglycan/LPS O-acetylase OafA/YrhL